MPELQPLQKPEDLTVKTTRQFLLQFTCFQTTPSLTAEAAHQVQAALKFLVDRSDFQTYGVCADSLEQGRQALEGYLAGLGHAVDLNGLPQIEGPVYMKYNLKNGKAYLDEYVGTARGVLVTCHGADEDEVTGTYGHLPLDLFAADA